MNEHTITIAQDRRGTSVRTLALPGARHGHDKFMLPSRAAAIGCRLAMHRHRIAFAVLAFFLAGHATAETQLPSAEAQAIVQTVIANAAWAAAARDCPTTVMHTHTAKEAFVENDCKPGRLAVCLDACTTGTSGACYWLAYELQRQKVAEDAPTALYHQACRLGVVSGCTNQAAGMLHAAKDDETTRACAAATFDLACTRDDPWACTMSAMHLSRGIGVPQDIPRALKALEKSCTFGPKDPACTAAIRMRHDLQAQSGKQAPEAGEKPNP